MNTAQHAKAPLFLLNNHLNILGLAWAIHAALYWSLFPTLSALQWQQVLSVILDASDLTPPPLSAKTSGLSPRGLPGVDQAKTQPTHFSFEKTNSPFPDKWWVEYHLTKHVVSQIVVKSISFLSIVSATFLYLKILIAALFIFSYYDNKKFSNDRTSLVATSTKGWKVTKARRTTLSRIALVRQAETF